MSANEHFVEQRYSSFYPLLIVLLALILVNAVDTLGMLKNRSVIRAQVEQSREMARESKVVQAKLVALSRELMALSPYSPTAAEIVKEYHIRATAPRTEGK